MLQVAVQGTRGFDTYSLFLRAMHHVLTSLDDDKEVIFYTAGPNNISSMLLGFINITADTRKANNVKARMVRLPPSEIKKKVGSIDKVLYFCKPKEPLTDLVKYFQNKDDNSKDDFVTIWRF
jgi:hypothetical protein